MENIEKIALASYLAITRNAGLPDCMAEEAYKENKESADKLTEFRIKHAIKSGEEAKKMIGHNSNAEEPKDVGGIAGQRLMSFIERIERLEEEKAALMEDIKEVCAEAKGVGFDVKAIRKLVKLRKMDSEKRTEEQQILELYASAIGMQGSFNI